MEQKSSKVQVNGEVQAMVVLGIGSCTDLGTKVLAIFTIKNYFMHTLLPGHV